MNKSQPATIENTAFFTIYRNVLLDADFTHYLYRNPVPVRLDDATRQVGTAFIKKSRNKLYADIQLRAENDYNNLFPHLPCDTRGTLTVLILSAQANFDKNIAKLADQVAAL